MTAIACPVSATPPLRHSANTSHLLHARGSDQWSGLPTRQNKKDRTIKDHQGLRNKASLAFLNFLMVGGRVGWLK